ncbi:MAG: hypothetical protein RL266_1355 [Bacteroidota bacterium]|jgi:hypothetical protein
MKIHVDDNRSISEIQEEFNAKFPYLKIEFFKKPHSAGEASALADMLPADSALARFRTVHSAGDITITPETTVETVESEFQNKFGLSAQVFRKSGAVWLETSATDGWTLKDQNEQGAFMEQEVGE